MRANEHLGRRPLRLVAIAALALAAAGCGADASTSSQQLGGVDTSDMQQLLAANTEVRVEGAQSCLDMSNGGRVDFGVVAVGVQSSGALHLRNCGSETLVLDVLSLDAGAPFAADGASWPLTLEAGAEADLALVFEPDGDQGFVAEAVLGDSTSDLAASLVLYGATPDSGAYRGEGPIEPLPPEAPVEGCVLADGLSLTGAPAPGSEVRMGPATADDPSYGLLMVSNCGDIPVPLEGIYSFSEVESAWLSIYTGQVAVPGPLEPGEQGLFLFTCRPVEQVYEGLFPVFLPLYRYPNGASFGMGLGASCEVAP